MVTTRTRKTAATANEQASQDSQSSPTRGRTRMADSEDDNSISQHPKRIKKTSPSAKDQSDKDEQEQLPMQVDKTERTTSSRKATSQSVVRRQPMRTCRVKKDVVMTTSRTRVQRKKKEEDNDPLIGHPKPALSMELWNLILVELAHFPPSQLIELALSSKAMFTMVMALPVWQNIVDQNIQRIGQVPKRGKTMTPYLHVFKHRARICEQCYDYTAANGSKAALPVFVIEEGRRIQMCLPCRQSYFQKHPEPTPATHDDEEDDDDQQQQRRRQRRRVVTKLHGQSMFRLSSYDMDSIPYGEAENPHYRYAAPMRLYEMETLRNHARHVHGGDVGIEAAVARSRMISETIQRNKEVRRRELAEARRQRREAVDNRLESEHLDRRTAVSEVLQYISHGRTLGFLSNPITTLDELVELIRTREERRAALVQRLENENVQVNPIRDVFVRYVSQGTPALDIAVERYIRQYGRNMPSQQGQQQTL